MGPIGVGPQAALAQSDGTVTTSAGSTTFDTTVGTAVIVDPYITASDTCASPDAIVEIAEGYVAGDVLAVPVTGGGTVGGTVSRRTITNATSWAALQTALRAVTFDTASSAISTRLIVFTVGCNLRPNAVYDDGTDHYYEYVSTSSTWTAAETAAAALTHAGLDGYLATIGSQGEQDFIESLVTINHDAWIGASDAYTDTPEVGPQTDADGEWYWVTGPEARTKFYTEFYTDTFGCLGYCNWSTNPVPTDTIRNYAYLSSTAFLDWDDLGNAGSVDGYVVEYGGTDFGGNVSTSAARDTKVVIVGEDYDGDGIPNSAEGMVDTDNDGYPDYNDLDSDGDGLHDATECPNYTAGCPNADSSLLGDNIPDYKESNVADADGDGAPDYMDGDSDGDNIPDATEGETDTGDGDGILDRFEHNTFDSDADGTPDWQDTDSDGDGTPDGCNYSTVFHCERFADSDGDGVPNRLESNTADSDGGGLPDYLDVDSDGDSIRDGAESDGSVTGAFADTDLDGIPDRLESDKARSGGSSSVSHQDDVNSDTDGNDFNEGLADSDGDGIPDRYENDNADSDGDTITDTLDIDSDSDGLLDGGIGGERFADKDNDGIPDRYEHNTADSDADGKPDYDDTDADGDDGLSCIVGGGTGADDGNEGYTDDGDGDGIPDRYESCAADSDGDGNDDEHDFDSDDDGIPDAIEGFADTDNDGIPDRYESNVADSDADGIPDYDDTDSDGDGKLDGDEGFVDTDTDGIPDRLESSIADSDADGTVDEQDDDSDDDGKLDGAEGLADTDKDGVPDRLESSIADSDADGTVDELDTDSDNDGDPDGEEALADTDEDGVPDRLESSIADSDADGVVDELDTDSDGDGTPDGAAGERLDDSDSDRVPNRIESSIRYSDGVSQTTGLTVTVGIPVGSGDDGGCAYPGTDQCDTDSDDDGISDGDEGLDDTDNDGVPNRLESNIADADNDGIKDFEDTDSDNDYVTDHVEGLKDDDGDNMPDRLESRRADSDGDGRYDEGDQNSDDDSAGNDGYEGFADTDGDGIQNRFESNIHYSDTDNTPDERDTDSDDDGIPDGCTCYGLPGGCPDNVLACEGFVDSDYDHVPDRYESNVIDTDADGKLDYLDTDSDDDDTPDGDYDCDLTYDEGEGLGDADGDHVPDRVEPANHYSDGNADDGDDEHDNDCDDDGVPDGDFDGNPTTPFEYLIDSDGDGILNRFESRIADSDGDGKVDEQDTDSDDDGDLDGDFGERLDDPDDHAPFVRDDNIPNRIESSIAHSDGISYTGSLDNVDELDPNSDSNSVSGDPVDDDPTERLFDDGDGDGIPDRLEANYAYSDANGKGCDGYISSPPSNYPYCDDEHDKDSDNDGIPDGDYIVNGIPNEGEGLYDYDNDGVPDRLEHNFRDTDGDGRPDYDDTDSDGDGIPDGAEWLLDSDGDLIPDRIESNITDTDGDGIFNHLDTDSDGDGILDTVEILDANPGPGTLLPGDDGFLGDRDGDGVWNYIDHDPTGYFYNRVTGEIVASPEISISVEGPEGAVITITHYGNEGFYQFSTDGTAGVYTLTLNGAPPTGYALDLAFCPPDPDPYNPAAPIDPPYDPADVSEIFNGEYADTGYLVYAKCTPWHLTFNLGVGPGDGDRIIINSNIPLIPTVGGHTAPMNPLALLWSRAILLVAAAGGGVVGMATSLRKRRK